MDCNEMKDYLDNLRVEAHKKDLGVLPRAEAASIHVAANSGKVKDGVLNAAAFIIMVKCHGEWRPENEWLHAAGMKTSRRVYTSIEKAREAKEDIKAKWGVKTAPKAKAKGRGPTKAELVDQVAALSALVEELRAKAKPQVKYTVEGSAVGQRI